VFKPAPTNALSRLTALTAGGILAFVVIFVLVNPEQPPVFIAEETVMIGLAVVSFVVPLRVMHSRLAAEKTRLLGESQDRIKAILGQIHRQTDQADVSKADLLHEAFAALLAEQAFLEKLHTWPWSTATIRGFASALLLPIALIVFTQVLSRLL
jgi:hypothetical protein